MRRAAVTLVSICFVVAATHLSALAHDPNEIPDLVDRVMGSVVDISASLPANESNKSADKPSLPNLPKDSPFEKFFDRFNEPQGKAGSKTRQLKGSGFVIDESGIIATADYVVKDAIEIDVILADDTKLPATLVGRDDKTGIALIKVSPRQPLKPLPFGDSSKVRVGQTIVAIGSPFGLGRSVTSGIVSALNRDLKSGPYDRYIQTDAAINKGNSGGPLLNLQGEVIGINTAIFSPTGASVGIAFAVPSNLARGVVAQLKEFGETRRGWLGVRIQTVTDDIAASLGLKDASGALVASVTPGSPADQGGVKTGDVIVTFGGDDVVNPRALARMAAATQIGSTVDVQVIRDGQRRTLKITIARLPNSPVVPPVGARTDVMPNLAEALGLTVERLTDQVRDKYKIAENAIGVVVTKIRPGSGAAEKGLKAGQVIVEVAGNKVSSPEDFSAKLNAAKRTGRKTVLLLVSDRVGLRFIAVPFS